MISEKMTQGIAKKYGLDAEKYQIAHRLQDFTDDEVRMVGKDSNPATFWRLLDAMQEYRNDAEINAHLLGYESYQQQQIQLEKCRHMQAEMNAQTNGQKGQ